MDLLLSPLSWILLAGLWLPSAIRTRRRRQWGFASCVLLGLVGLLGAMPLGANLLVGPLESDASQETACTMAAPATIVTLAGGADRADRADREVGGASDFKRLSLASLRRAIATVTLWRTQPGDMLIFSGGRTFPGAPAESTLMESFAAALGVPAATMQVEATSMNTWENARGVAALMPSPRRIWLVTSALHMRRARFAFVQAGFEVCPYPTDRRFMAFGLPGYLIPQAGAALKSEQALHEWVGLAYYHWLAWRAG